MGSRTSNMPAGRPADADGDGLAPATGRTRGRSDVVVVAALAAIVLGIVFRFANLDAKVYWLDEAYTSLALSGHSNADVLRELGDGRSRAPHELQRYQRVDPDGSLARTLGLLARHNPHQAPLYPLLARTWATWVGDDVGRLRALSALLALLAVGAFGWVSRELFGDRRTTWIALGLVAVSPIVVLHAQEARCYALWSLLVLVATGCLLRAQRLGTRRAWALYAFALALGLHTQVLTVLVLLAHAVTVPSFRDARSRWRWTAAAGGALAAAAPWLLNLALGADTARGQLRWAEATLGPIDWASRATLQLGTVLADLRARTGPSWEVLPIVALVAWAACRPAPATRGARHVLLVALLLIPWLGLALPDVAFGGKRATVVRYLVPSHLAALLLLAGFLAGRTAPGAARATRGAWSLATIVLLGLATLSDARSAGAETWWTKSISMENAEVARRLNGRRSAVVLVPASRTHLDVLALAAHLDGGVRIVFVPDGSRPDLADDGGPTFLYGPLPPPFPAPAIPGVRLEAVPGVARLWRVRPATGTSSDAGPGGIGGGPFVSTAGSWGRGRADA